MSAGPAEVLVVDASVATKWLLTDEEHVDRARLILQHFAEGKTQIVAPAHLRYEVPSAITAATVGRRSRLSPEEGKEAIDEFLELGLQTVETDELIRAAYPLVHQHGCSFYDALYLALAQDLGVPLVTADRQFYQRVRRLSQVVWIGDYPAEAR